MDCSISPRPLRYTNTAADRPVDTTYVTVVNDDNSDAVIVEALHGSQPLCWCRGQTSAWPFLGYAPAGGVGGGVLVSPVAELVEHGPKLRPVPHELQGLADMR